jgi:hypothetical protein
MKDIYLINHILCNIFSSLPFSPFSISDLVAKIPQLVPETSVLSNKVVCFFMLQEAICLLLFWYFAAI